MTFTDADKAYRQIKEKIITAAMLPGSVIREAQLMEEGYYNIYASAGARTEMPGCSLCMGNQARVADDATVFSTSTRNFPNRLGNGANVYLASAELSAVTATLGYIPTMAEYMERMKSFDAASGDIYRYLNFDQIPDYTEIADTVTVELAQG